MGCGSVKGRVLPVPDNWNHMTFTGYAQKGVFSPSTDRNEYDAIPENLKNGSKDSKYHPWGNWRLSWNKNGPLSCFILEENADA